MVVLMGHLTPAVPVPVLGMAQGVLPLLTFKMHRTGGRHDKKSNIPSGSVSAPLPPPHTPVCHRVQAAVCDCVELVALRVAAGLVVTKALLGPV